MTKLPTRAKKYNAFLSYDHDDKWLADELRSALHSFARPWLAMRAVRIYRDESSMATTHDLWGTIVKAIQHSEHFLLLVSPASVASDYVQQELVVFLEGGSAGKLILVLAQGELAWDATAGGLLLNGQRIFPNIEKTLFETAPLWEDLSWVEKEKRGEYLSLKTVRFRSVVAGISARLRGVDKDELDGRDIVEHRKKVWAFRTLFACVILSALIAGWQWYKAQAEARIALARALSTASALLLAREPNLLETSVLLAVESLRQQPTAAALEALTEALDLLPRQVALVSHDGEINQVAFTPDGAHLVTATDWDGIKRVWEVASGRLVAETKHEDSRGRLSLSHDGRFVLFGDNLGAVLLWDWRAPAPNMRVVVEKGADTFHFSPDGRYVVVVLDTEASAKSRAVSLYEVESAQKVHVISGDDGARGLTFNSQGGQQTTEDQVFFRGDTVEIGAPDERGERFHVVHEREVNDVAFCPSDGACSGQYVATASDDGTARLWDRRLGGSSRGYELARMTHRGPVLALAFSHDGKLLATGSADGTAKVWDYSRAPRLVGSAYIDDSVRSMSFNAGGDTLLIAEEKGKDLHLSLWEVASGKVTREPVEVPGRHAITVHVSNDRRTELSPGGRYLATHSPTDERGGEIVVIETATRREAARVKVSGEVKAVAFSQDGGRLAASILSVGIVLQGPGGLTTGIGGDTNVMLWETEGGTPLAEVKGVSGENLAMSPQGLHVAVFGYDKVSVWTVNGGGPPWEIKEDDSINGLAFSPDGKHLAVCAGTQTKVYDLERREPVSTTAHRRTVLEATFSADGTLLATFGEDLTARVWEVASGGELWRVTVPEAPIRLRAAYGTPLKLAFSPGGEYLAGIQGYPGSRARIWRIRGQELITEAGHLVTCNLSRTEWRRYAAGEYRKTFDAILCPAGN